MKKLYSLALGLLAVAFSANADVKIGETSYATLNDAYAAAVDGDILTVHGVVNVGTRVTFENKTLTIVGADENAQLKRQWKKTGMFIKVGKGSNITFKNLTWCGSTIENPGSSFEISDGGTANFENFKLIEVNQTNSRTIEYKSTCTGGSINGLTYDNSCNFVMNPVGGNGWAVFYGKKQAITISGTNDFNMYIEKDLLAQVSDLENSNILVGFDTSNANRFKAGRAIIRGTGDASQIKSAMPGYALVKEGNKTNLRIELAPLAITCDGEAVEGDEFLFANGSYNFTVANAGTGIEYSYKFTEAAAQTFAEEGFTVFDPASGITVDKEGTLEISAVCATMNEPNVMTRTINISSTTGIDGIMADENAPVEYYNLQGIRVENPENGIFIRRQGNKTTKVAL